MNGFTILLIGLFIISVLIWNPVEGGANRCKKLTPPSNGRLHKHSSSLYRFSCHPGYKLVGKTSYQKCTVNRRWRPRKPPTCEDINECQLTGRGYPCSEHAECINTVGSVECVCKPGFTGNGFKCEQDPNEFENYLRVDDLCGIVSQRVINNTSRNRIRRIIGGQNSRPGQWPWMALITLTSKTGSPSLLGGALIKPGWVLTVASLLHDHNGTLVKEENLIVSLGENDLNKPENEEQQFRVQKIFTHKRFKQEKLQNDIALLQLDGKATITDFVNTVCLISKPKAKLFERGRHLATISGWGLTKAYKYNSHPMLYSGVLKGVTLPILGPHKCQKASSYSIFNKKTMLCAGVNDREAAPCIGDGGSPLSIQDPITKRWLLLGLFSWSEGCGQPSKYSYYTRVARYRRWIDKITRSDNER